MSDWNLTLLFFVILIGGLLLEAYISQIRYFRTGKGFNKHKGENGRYALFLIAPVAASLVAISQRGVSLVYVYLAFAVVGTALEWLGGFSYAMVTGQRLWTYHRYRIGPYTSWHAVPAWGACGILFWLLVSVF